MVSIVDVLDAVEHQESGGNRNAVSSVGARGNFQFMPATWKQYGGGKSINDPVASRDAAARYLIDLYKKHGSLPLALAAYNGGDGGANFLKRNPNLMHNPDRKAPRNQWRNQTADYVNKIMNALNPIGSARADETPYQEPSDYEQTDDPITSAEPEHTRRTVATQPEIYDEIPEGAVPIEEVKPPVQAQSELEIYEEVPQGAIPIDDPAQPLTTPEQQLDAINGEAAQTKQPTSLADKLIGTGEAALSTVTGNTGGVIGMVGGAAKSLADHLLAIGNIDKEQYRAILNDPNYTQKMVEEGANSLTYQPRTEEGRRQAAAVGDFANNVLVGLPMGAEMGAINPRASMTQAGEIARPITEIPANIASGVKNASLSDLIGANPERIAVENTRKYNAELAKTTPEYKDLSSAGTETKTPAQIRQEQGLDFPYPFVDETGYTHGQLTRDPLLLAAEQDAAKTEAGRGLVDRVNNQEKNIYDNLNYFLDETNALSHDNYEAGGAVVNHLSNEAAKAKSKVTAEYNKAAASPEGDVLVDLKPLNEYINENIFDNDLAPVLGAVKGKIGGAQELPLRQLESLRKTMNNAAKNGGATAEHARVMKEIVDKLTDENGGDLYKGARDMYRGYAETFKNKTLASKLLETVKGSSERKIALEHVYAYIVYSKAASRDSLAKLKALLTGSGEEGVQAWNELQGRVIADIIKQTERIKAPNAKGEAPVSVAGIHKVIDHLDSSGKLDVLFSHKQATQLRELADVAKTLFTSPNGVVNASNNRHAMLALATEIGAMAYTTGIPLPVKSLAEAAWRAGKNKKEVAKVKAALNPSLTGKIGEKRATAGTYEPAQPEVYEPFDPLSQYKTEPRPQPKPASLANALQLTSNAGSGTAIKLSDGSTITRADRVKQLIEDKGMSKADAIKKADFEAANPAKQPRDKVSITDPLGKKGVSNRLGRDGEVKPTFTAEELNSKEFATPKEARDFITDNQIAHTHDYIRKHSFYVLKEKRN